MTGVISVAALSVFAVAAATSATATTQTTTSFTTPGEFAYAVPPGTVSLQVTVVGAAGGMGDLSPAQVGGGAVVTATIVPPSGASTLYVEVGAAGTGSSGGQASAIQTCSSTSAACSSSFNAVPGSDPRLVVAGGGGASGWGGQGGAGGDASGGSGAGAGGTGSDSAQASAGGAAGLSGSQPAVPAPVGLGDQLSPAPGLPGTPNTGGAGGVGISGSGGGGGSGWMGGSGGGAGGFPFGASGTGGGGGGGGGSSFVELASLISTFGAAGSTPSQVTIVATGGEAPAITSAASATFTVGQADSFTVNTTGSPTPAVSDGGVALPSSLHFVDNGNGTATLSGTPGPGTGGVHTLTITADNGILPVASQPFTLTVLEAPMFTSSPAATFFVGHPGTFTVTTTGFPTPAIGALRSLPNGLTFHDNGDGTAVLSGTAQTGSGADYSLTLQASNLVTTTSQPFSLRVVEAPVITSPDHATFTVGQAGFFPLTATGFPQPSIFTNTSLPPGLTLGGGGITGTPAPGTGRVWIFQVVATNASPTAAFQLVTLTVDEAPSIISAAAATFEVGQPGVFTVKASGFPAGPTLAISQGGGALPSGLSLLDNQDGTATLSGTPAAGSAGIYHFNFAAANGVAPDATQAFTLTVAEPPKITSASSATFVVSQAGSFTVTTTGVPSPAITVAGASLPAGLTFVDNGNGTATLSGTPAAGTGGSYTLRLSAANGFTPDDIQAFTLTINQSPAITSGAAATFTVGQAGSFTVTTTGLPGGATLAGGAGLPSGVSFVDNHNGTATLGGTPAAGTVGSYTFNIAADNGVAPAASQAFTLTVIKASPTLSTIPSPVSLTLGSSPAVLNDVATLSGGVSPGGTITFTLTGPSNTVVDTEIATVGGNGSYVTPTGFILPATGSVTGSYHWVATYSSDGNNNAAADSYDLKETVTVSAAKPSLATVPNGTSLTLGTNAPNLQDTATLSGGYSETGTITFTLTGPANTVIDTETVPVSGNGSYSTTAGLTLTTTGAVAGTYQWIASYAGDVNNAATSAGPDPSERVTVSSATPALTTTPDPSSTLDSAGATLTDSATLSGGYFETGTITFTLQGPTSALIDTETVSVTGNGTYSTPAGFTLAARAAAGTYQWNVTYVGDANNAAVADTSNPAEQVIVTDPSIRATGTSISATEGSTSTGPVATFTDPDASGKPADYSATISWGDGSPAATGTITGPMAGIFTVIGTHAYADEGTFTVTVTITDANNTGNSATATSTASVSDATLTAETFTLSNATESGAAANAGFDFTDANPNAAAADFTATINWGDGSSSAAAVTTKARGGFTATGSHTYADEGSYDVTIAITDDGSSSMGAGGTTAVADAALAASTFTLNNGTESGAAANAGFNFTDANPNATASDFTATINWGDGQSTTGVVAVNASGGFTATGSHTYVDEGSFQVTVAVADDSGSSTGANGTAAVADAALAAGTFTLSNGTESGAAASAAFNFTDANPNATAADFTATINWGDGQSTTGVVTVNASGGFTATASHIYADEGSFKVTIAVADDGAGTTGANGTVAATDATMTAGVLTFIGAPGATNASFNFTDANPNATAADFTATINWGDGLSSVGGVATNRSGGFTATGSHTYANSGSFMATVLITDDGGSTVTATGTATTSLPDAALTIEFSFAAASRDDALVIVGFTDSDPGSSLRQLTATISWGDGTTSQGLVLSFWLDHGYLAIGFHDYASAGTYTVVLTVHDSGGATASVTKTIVVRSNR